MTAPLRILLVEDSESDAKLVAHALKRCASPVQTERVEDAASMRAALAAGKWDAVISDWALPQFSGLDALRLMKGMGLDLPFIIVSGTLGEEVAVDAMREGAADFVLKDNLGRLAPAVDREVRQAANRAAQRNTEARFARLSESGIIGIALTDMLGNVHDANDTYLQMLGYTREEVLSGAVRWADLTPPESRPGDARAAALLETTGVAPLWEKEMLRKDGRRVPVMIAVARLEGVSCIACAVDISERKKAEASLRQTEDQLRHAQKMEAVGLLAGGIAHDFNNLLTVILSYAEMLSSDLKAGDPMRAEIDEIRLAGERATTLTRQLLSFSRQQIIAPRVLSLNYVLANMDKMLRRLIREDVQLATLPHAELGLCKADPGQIEQVIMNLVVNARDAMPDGGKLTIETANVDLGDAYASTHLGVKPGRYVMLAITDTGLGMDKQTQSRIFEPFFTTKPKGQGTGLGLSTVFGIIEQSGGSIWVYSEPGHGTTFKVYLPMTKEAARADVVEPLTAMPRGTETILLVEDEDQIRNVARGILQRSGYRVLEARNAGEALLTCEQHGGTIDLVVTDVIMPRMNGKQLAERLARLQPTMRVLFMSGYTDGALVDELAAGAAFLQKPLTPAVLARKVREVLDLKR